MKKRKKSDDATLLERQVKEQLVPLLLGLERTTFLPTGDPEFDTKWLRFIYHEVQPLRQALETCLITHDEGGVRNDPKRLHLTKDLETHEVKARTSAEGSNKPDLASLIRKAAALLLGIRTRKRCSPDPRD